MYSTYLNAYKQYHTFPIKVGVAHERSWPTARPDYDSHIVTTVLLGSAICMMFKVKINPDPL